MQKEFDVCIRGGGITGRTLALLLARQHLRVALQVNPPQAATALLDVRAYALNAQARHLLQSLRCWPHAQEATAVKHMHVHGDLNGQVHFDAHEGAAALAWIVDVPALEKLLHDALGFQPSVEIVEAPVPAPLTVICEGRHSSTRNALGVEFVVDSYGQHAIAARLECARAHEQCAYQWFGPDGSVCALLPMGGAHGTHVALVWSVPSENHQRLLELEPAAFASELEFTCQSALGSMALCSERKAWPLQQAQARQWAGTFPDMPTQSWALAGDAAHNVHPLAGHGLNLGLGDVRALAAILSARPAWRKVNDPHLLRQYERTRRTDSFTMQKASDGMQRLFAQHNPLCQKMRNWAMQCFDALAPLKSFAVRQAAGSPGATTNTTRKPHP